MTQAQLIEDVSAARRRIQPIQDAVRAGDVEAFKAALFNEEPGFVTPQMAQDLRYGFASSAEGMDVGCSLAELCFFQAQLEMLRIALEARHPDMVDGLLTGSREAWLAHLSTYYLAEFSESSTISLPAMACWYSMWHHAPDFLELALEYAPEDAGAEAVEANDPPSAALIRAARMRIRLKASGSDAEPPVPATPRRSRVV